MVPMNATVKWIGGGTLALALGLGALAFGSTMLDSPAVAEETAPLAATSAPSASEKPVGVHGALAAKTLADIERRANEPFVIKSILPIEGPMKYGEWHWNTDTAPKTGKLVVTVDLEARTVSVFRDGHEIGAAVAMLGTELHPTPTGKFPILTKERHNVSEKYGNAPMPWTLRLTWDGIAIHGGSEVENGYASHGCIAVPDQFVSKLFDIAKKGDTVIITNGERIGVGDSIAS